MMILVAGPYRGGTGDDPEARGLPVFTTIEEVIASGLTTPARVSP